MACKHSICGVCGGKKTHTKYIGIGATLNNICSAKCQAALKKECSCKCQGKFHKGANKDLMKFLLEPLTYAPIEKSKSKIKSKKVIFQPITMYDYLAEFLNGVRIKTSSFDRHSDRNYRKDNKKLTLFWLSPKGQNIDTLANDFISETGFNNYDESDIINAIVNYINDYPSGLKQYIKDVEAERIRADEFYEQGMYENNYNNEPIIFGQMKLKKGSAAAKAFMAKIRAKKGTAKKTAAKKIGAAKKTASKKVGVIKKEVYIEFMNSSKGFKTDRKYFNTYNDALKFMNNNFEKSNPDMIKYVSTTKKVGATKKPIQTKHKDIKSHNVKISVLSGINDNVVLDLKFQYDQLKKWNYILDNLKIEATKKYPDKGLISAVKMDITRVKNHIKDIKKTITMLNRKIK